MLGQPTGKERIMPGTEENNNQNPEFRLVNMDELIIEVANDLTNPDNPNSEECAEFVKNMELNMHEGEMTEGTATTIATAFTLCYQLTGGSEPMRIDFGTALKELTETNSQHQVIFGAAAEEILKVTMLKAFKF
jgi:hypothetical protein